MPRLMSVSLTEQAVVERRKTVCLWDNGSAGSSSVITNTMRRGSASARPTVPGRLRGGSSSMTTVLNAQRLREVVTYDPEAGVFHWLPSTSGRSGRARPRVGDPAGWTEPSGYVRIGIDGQKHLAHRLAWLYVYGQWPQGELDHVNGDRGDFRIANLREVDRSGNMLNTGSHHDAQSDLLGVYPSTGRWAASLTVRGEYRWLGRFDTPEEAHAAYLRARESL